MASTHVDPDSKDAGESPLEASQQQLRAFKAGLQGCMAKFTSHTNALLSSAIEKLGMNGSSCDDLQTIRIALQTLQECHTICSEATTCLDSVSTMENEADGTVVQFLVSTNGNTIRGKNLGHGKTSRQVQVAGHMTDESVVKLFQDGVKIVAPDTPDPERVGRDFSKRYGPGVSLVPGTVVGKGGAATA